MLYFITENYIKLKTPITRNVDVNEVTPFIQSVSNRRIQPILGSHFYNDLLLKYNAQSLDADETTLVELLQPCIAWYGAAEAVLALSYQLKNKGLQKQNGDFSESVSKDEILLIYDHYQSDAAFYEQRIRVFLKENGDNYAEYISTDNTDSDMKPDKNIQTNTGYTNNIIII
jgi:predicted ATP-binding protein involved in virulence